MEENKTEDGIQDKGKQLATKVELVTFAYDVGMAIAVPLIIFALGGRMLDRHFATSPLFLIIGLLISLISTSIIIWKKTKSFL